MNEDDTDKVGNGTN